MASRYKMLDAGYGVLNPSYGNQAKRSYDTEEVSFFSTMMKTAKDTLGQQELANPGPMIGICLRVEGTTSTSQPLDPTSWYATTTNLVDGSLPVDGPELLQIRVRVPELHASLPIPQDLPEPSAKSPDHDIIDQYPIFTAQTRGLKANKGDLVWIDFQNKETMQGGIFLSVVDNATAAPPSQRQVLSKEPFESETTPPPGEETPPTEESESEEVVVEETEKYEAAKPPSGLPKNHTSRRSERLANKDRKIPKTVVIVGVDSPEVVKPVEDELAFWTGKVDGNGKFEEGRPERERIITYCKHSKVGNPAKFYEDQDPWSAVFISYVMRNVAGFIPKSSHDKYTRFNGDTRGDTPASSPWKAYSVLGDQKDRIVANVGDILVKPRYYPRDKVTVASSHGDVVYKIEGGNAILAGGNLSSTAKVAANLRLNSDGTYGNVGEYEIILKANSKEEPIAVS
mgnify:CR=1 FL=1